MSGDVITTFPADVLEDLRVDTLVWRMEQNKCIGVPGARYDEETQWGFAERYFLVIGERVLRGHEDILTCINDPTSAGKRLMLYKKPVSYSYRHNQEVFLVKHRLPALVQMVWDDGDVDVEVRCALSWKVGRRWMAAQDRQKADQEDRRMYKCLAGELMRIEQVMSVEAAASHGFFDANRTVDDYYAWPRNANRTDSSMPSPKEKTNCWRNHSCIWPQRSPDFFTLFRNTIPPRRARSWPLE